MSTTTDITILDNVDKTTLNTDTKITLDNHFAPIIRNRSGNIVNIKELYTDTIVLNKTKFISSTFEKKAYEKALQIAETKKIPTKGDQHYSFFKAQQKELKYEKVGDLFTTVFGPTWATLK